MNNAPGTIWDTVIIGGGPAGCAAAVVLARVRRKVIVIDDGKPRNKMSRGIHNYLTRDGILPADFREESHKELARYQVPVVSARAVKAEALGQHGFAIWDNNGQKYISRRLLVATGVTDNIPAVPGMAELWGSYVIHCPFCDGWESCDKIIGLYASRRNGYGMAIALRQLSEKVILFTDKARYLRPEQKAQLAARHIDVVATGITSVRKPREGILEVLLEDGRTVECECMFTHHGNTVNNDLVKQLGVQCSRIGAIPVGRNQDCNIAGVYLAGDVVFDVQFVAVAAAEGVKAAVAIHNDLLRTDNAILRR